MEIKVAEINAPLNLMKRKLSTAQSEKRKRLTVAIIGFDREPLSREALMREFFA